MCTRLAFFFYVIQPYLYENKIKEWYNMVSHFQILKCQQPSIFVNLSTSCWSIMSVWTHFSPTHRLWTVPMPRPCDILSFWRLIFCILLRNLFDAFLDTDHAQRANTLYHLMGRYNKGCLCLLNRSKLLLFNTRLYFFP